MPRFFLVQDRISESASVILSIDETNHLRVMRLKPADILYITDGTGRQYKAQITAIEKSRAVLKILSNEIIQHRLRPKITLGQAVARYNKIEFILQKTTELGVDHICLLKTERSFLTKDKPLSQNRWQRWERIISEAAKQSGRTDLPILEPPQTLDSFLQTTNKAHLKICLWEEKAIDQNLRDFLRSRHRPDSISLLIGPEGSFSPNEIEKIEASGYHTVLCGPRIMRVETAAITSMAICQYEWGDF